MLPKSTILTTNSASFRSGELVSEVRNRSRVLNTLYYIPPRNRCVEMMSCGYTSPELITFLRAQMEEMGMLPIVVGNESTGLIFPRIFGALKRETLKVGLCLSPTTRLSLFSFKYPLSPNSPPNSSLLTSTV
jgi:3-hydroxyacyl-CoA dehydrogenase